MAAQGLPGLAGLTQLLTTPAPAEAVIEELVTGPLAEFDAVAGILMHGVADHLVMVGSYGYSPGDLAGFETIPVAADLPICRAYREGEYSVTSTVVVEAEFPAFADDATRWVDFRERTPHGSIVSVPLVSQGVAIGCLGFSCSAERDWGPTSFGLLDCLSCVVAMWMAHPISGLTPEQRWVSAGPIALTARQQRVLRLCSEGRSTTEIAFALAFSESTVKQELQRLMRLFEASDRATVVQRARLLGLIDGGAS